MTTMNVSANTLAHPAEVVERRDDPGVWSVEAINLDGSVEVALFPGPKSKDRATEYAAWRYGVAA